MGWSHDDAQEDEQQHLYSSRHAVSAAPTDAPTGDFSLLYCDEAGRAAKTSAPCTLLMTDTCSFIHSRYNVFPHEAHRHCTTFSEKRICPVPVHRSFRPSSAQRLIQRRHQIVRCSPRRRWWLLRVDRESNELVLMSELVVIVQVKC